MPKREYFIDQRGEVVWMRSDTSIKSCGICACNVKGTSCINVIPAEHRTGDHSMDMLCVKLSKHYVKQ